MVENNYPPTVREIADLIGWKSAGGIYTYLEMLEDEGRLTWDRGSARTIKIPGVEYVVREENNDVD